MTVLDLIRKLHNHAPDDFVFAIEAELQGLVIVDHKDVKQVTVIEASEFDADYLSAKATAKLNNKP